MIIGCGCEPATGALEDQRDEVACHEDNCIGAGAEAGDVLAVDDDYAGQAEVKGASNEGGSNCKRYKIAMRAVRSLFSILNGMYTSPVGGGGLHDEVVEVERVVVQHNSAGISNNFKNETTDHADHESPGLVLDAEPELRNKKQAKSSSVNGISSERGLVFYLSTAERTCCHGAVDNALERANVSHLCCSFEKFPGFEL